MPRRASSKRDPTTGRRRNKLGHFVGPNPRSFSAICRRAGICYVTVKHRMDNLGWSLKRALSVPAGQAWQHRPSVSRIARKHNVRAELVHARLHAGWSLRRALSTPLNASRVKRGSLSSIAKRHGIDPDTLYNRLKLGWSRHRALTTPVERDRRNPKSLSSRARAAGLSNGTVQHRLNKGWSLKRALRTPPRTERTDPNSVSGLARKAGLNPGTVLSRIQSGWTKEKALSTPPLHSYNSERAAAIREAANEARLPYELVRSRLRKGMSLTAATSASSNMLPGKVGASLTRKLCRDAGINYGTLIYRMRERGMSFQEALIKPLKSNSGMKAAAHRAGLKYGTVWFRVHKCGLTLEQALLIPKNAPELYHQPNSFEGRVRASRTKWSSDTVRNRMRNGMSFEEATSAPDQHFKSGVKRAA